MKGRKIEFEKFQLEKVVGSKIGLRSKIPYQEFDTPTKRCRLYFMMAIVILIGFWACQELTTYQVLTHPAPMAFKWVSMHK